MKKDMKNKEGKKKKHSHGHSHGHTRVKPENETESIAVDEMIHCEEDLTVLKLEFILVRIHGTQPCLIVIPAAVKSTLYLYIQFQI